MSFVTALNQILCYFSEQIKCMRTIIVPTDFSAVATNAMHYALDLAVSLKAKVILFHTYEIPVSYVGTEVPLPIIDIAELEKINQDKLAEIKTFSEKKTAHVITIETELRVGDFVSELQDFADQQNPFAIIMGTKGAGFVERLFLGSSTLSTIRQLTWPVWVIPPGSTFRTIDKLGFACDFRSVEESTPIGFIKDLAETFQAELFVLNVDYENRHFKPETPEQSVKLHYLLRDLKPQYFFIENDNVEEGISRFGEKNGLDLIITIPKKQTLLNSLFQKSHSAELAIHATIPIVSVHE